MNTRKATNTLLCALVFLVPPVGAQAAKTEPLSPDLVGIEDCPTEPGCPAAILLEEVVLDNEFHHARVSTRRVIKIFKPEGLNAANVSLPFVIGSWNINDLQGRTIRPDGSEVRLDPSSAIEQTVTKARRFRRKDLSFQMPGAEVGAILEYRFKRIYKFHLGGYVWDVQTGLPIVKATLSVVPGEASYTPKFVNIRAKWDRDTDEKGRARFTLRHIPSFKEEPMMPPLEEAQGRIILYPVEPWWNYRTVGYGFSEFLKKYYKRSSKTRKLTKEVLGEAGDPETKLLRIYTWIQDNIENASFQESSEGEVVQEDRNLYVDDVVDGRQGSSRDLTRLFVYLARQAGLEAEVALVATRDEVFFRSDIYLPGDMSDEVAAVRMDGAWRFYDPGTPYCPPGMVSWEKEGVTPNAIIPRATGAVLEQVQPSRADDNVRRRVLQVTLDPEGGFLAEVELEATGLAGMEMRNRLDNMTVDDRRRSLEEELQEFFADVEVLDLEYTNLEDWGEPLRGKYRFQVSRYAEVAGSRLLIPASLFHAGIENPFYAPKRTHPIYFRRASTTLDVITFKLPEGYEVEDLPHRRRVDIRALKYQLKFEEAPGEVQITREMKIDILLVEAKQYDVVQKLYADASLVDASQIVLRRAGPPEEEAEVGP